VRRAAKRDANETTLVRFAEQLGAMWEQEGPLDGWTLWRGVWTPTEIKNPDGRDRYTDSQVLFLAHCKERNAPVWTWRTIDDVLTCLNAKIAA
jgi:hypothetical protein